MIGTPSEALSALDRAILHTMIYADVFDYPLRSDEIHRYLTGVSASPIVVSARLRELVPGVLERRGAFYVLPGREAIVAQRERREKLAARLWSKALGYGRWIARLPFVRMLAVTGSLAVNNVEAGADLDFLIVTRAGRLWLCRALILALGRLAELEGLRICPNYLISECSLVFSEQTLYAAHELTQMVPLSGQEVYDRIRRLNGWVDHFLPNAEGAPLSSLGALRDNPDSQVRLLLESLLLTRPGNWIEKWEMERKIRKLRLENDNNPEASFSVDLCKGHYNRHGQRTEYSLRERLEGFSLEFVP